MNKYVSGIRPSGKLHLGNYLGAIRHWKSLQDAGHDCFFFVADMHGRYTEDEVYKTLRDLVKIGITHPIRQSSHKEGLLDLQHELSFYANTSRLDNMTQYKEKGGTLALYSYPVLMAADIFFHEATHVPIGADQKQHLEFVRELAKKTGRWKPSAVVHPLCSRVMGLKDATKKMSKSDPDDDQRINLCDDADTIVRKIKGATTADKIYGDTPAAKNLLEIYTALGGNTCHVGWSSFKKELTDLLVTTLGK
jgi:tryptophanyl-tRNA synthetase